MGMDLARKDFGTTPEYFIAGATIRIAKAVKVAGQTSPPIPLSPWMGMGNWRQ